MLHCILTSCQEVNKYLRFFVTLYCAVNALTNVIYLVRIVFTLNFFACLVRGRLIISRIHLCDIDENKLLVML